MLQVFIVISQKFFLQKKASGYAKVIHKNVENNEQVSEIFKIIGTQMLA
jgi:hypothetical protein